MKNTLLILLSASFFIGLSNPLKAQMFEFSSKDAAKLTGRKLIVVMQEEETDMLKRLKKNQEKTARYKALIAYNNLILKKSISKFWKTNQTIEYRTMTECISIGDSSQAYFILDFASLREQENQQLYQLKPDTANPYNTRLELIRRKEYGFFELKLIEKLRTSAFYTFYTPSSFPNEYDFATAVQFMSVLVNEKLNDVKFSTRDFELKIQQANLALSKKILVVDSAIVNRQGKSYAYIKNEYDSSSNYLLTTPKEIADIIFGNDTGYVYFNIVPYVDPIARGQSYIGTTGGSLNDYEKVIYYMQLIIDSDSGEIIYYDKTEENVVVVRDWRRFQRYSRDSSFALPSFQKNTTPTQEKYYQQNQY